MIYIFKNQTDNACSIVYKSETLSNEAKFRAVAILDKLPTKYEPEDHYSMLKYNPNTKEVYWDYVPIEIEELE